MIQRSAKLLDELLNEASITKSALWMPFSKRENWQLMPVSKFNYIFLTKLAIRMPDSIYIYIGLES